LPLPPPPTSPGGQRLAEFTDRLVAYIIDYAILSGVISVITIPAYLIVFFRTFDDFPNQMYVDEQLVSPELGPGEVFQRLLPFFGVMALLIVVALALTYLYEVELMYRSGQTIGKRVMKIRIVPIDPAATLTRGMAFRRYLVQYVAGAIVPFLTYVDGFWQLWDKPYRQCLHDKWATTVVIKLDP
jgi:uncharacterized RDD family membrane protein YckC